MREYVSDSLIPSIPLLLWEHFLQCTNSLSCVAFCSAFSKVCEQSSTLVVQPQWDLGVESPFVLHDCISLSQCWSRFHIGFEICAKSYTSLVTRWFWTEWQCEIKFCILADYVSRCRWVETCLPVSSNRCFTSRVDVSSFFWVPHKRSSFLSFF